MEIAQKPHAVLFPFAVLGHVRPLLQLARRLANEFGFKVTFVTTSYIYRKMDLAHASRDGDDVQFLDLQEGFPDSYYTIATMKTLIKEGSTIGPKLIECLKSLSNNSVVTCVVSDLVFDEAHRAALHQGIPSVAFSSQCAMATVAKYYGLRLVEQGLVPVPKDATQEYLDSKMVTNIPGMHPMKLKDYYSGLLVTDIEEPFFQFVVGEHSSSLHQREWILSNSVLELETSVVEAFEQDAGLRVTTVGPLAVLAAAGDQETAGTYWPEQGSALEWLDQRAATSVVYVSFGSLATVPVQLVEEILLGLERSQVPFLMVIRMDGVQGNRAVIDEIQKRTRDRALFMSWAPQQKVLAHPAIAGFLSHCGWNSFLESVSAGVPILCHPFFLDQPMIARYIVSVWEMGLELEKRADGSVDRDEVAKKVKVLAAKESVMRTNAKEWQRVATEAVKGGGSSQSNLAAFVDDMYRRAGAST